MAAPAPTTSCWAPATRSGSATATATPPTPPNYAVNPTSPGTPLVGNASALIEIENPNPQPGTNNYYIAGRLRRRFGLARPRRAERQLRRRHATSIVPMRPSPASARSWTTSTLRARSTPHCEAGHYYLLNNYNPGYFGDGTNAYTDTNAKQLRLHRSRRRRCATIGDALIGQACLLGLFRRPVQSLSRRQI